MIETIPLTMDAARRNKRAYYLHRIINNKSAVTGMLILFFLIFIAVFASWLAPYSPNEQILTNRLLPMSWEHLLGTDELGRDILSRIIYGSRAAVYVVSLVSIIAGPFGLVLGVISGYFEGIVDATLMRLTDICLAFPKLILALALVSVLGPGINNAIIAIAITSWAPYTRLARAHTLTIKNSEYIDAIRVQGATHKRIIFKHITPMCVSALLIQVSLDMSGYILSVAGLGFLGLGAQPPMSEWGAMIATGREYILEHWWLITFPGIAIAIVSIGFNLLGDGLRDVFDPKHTEQGI